MPKYGVPSISLSDNGPQFTSSVVRCFCESIRAAEIYSMPYHPHGSSIVKSYMRSVKKGLAALMSEDARDGNLFLSAVALA